MKAKQVVSLVVLGGMLLSGCGVSFSGFKAKAQRDEGVSAPLASGKVLTADTSFGGIKIRGADVQTCEVQAHIKVQAGTQEKADALLEEVFVVLEPKGNGLTLSVDKPHLGHNESVGVSYDIVVPHRTTLDCTTSFGTVRVAQIEGDVKAKTSFGSIHCDGVTGNLNLKTSHGKIDMRDILSPDMDAETSFGSIVLVCRESDASSGHFTLKTSHGSITAKNMKVPELDGKTSFGSMSVTYAPDGPEDLDVTLSSSHGSLSMTPPEAFKGRVELSTSHGSIGLDRPVTVQGKLSKDRISGSLGNGPGTIRMNTSFASVKLH
ncbi:MAG: DUF4097 family beta strand repeat protein [Phycisphaeraceae bacterium]|nr:DUF4097 family beta strand repeat protein [Phycisphaeraceae bacterium]